MNKLRFVVDILLSLFLLFGVAPLLLLGGFVYALRFAGYWEFLVFGFLFELLYGGGGWQLPFPLPVFFGSALLLLCAAQLRKFLRS
jgi:hypothetical protein